MKEYKYISAQSVNSLSETVTELNEMLAAEGKYGWIPSGDPQLSVASSNSLNANRASRYCILQRLTREVRYSEKEEDGLPKQVIY